MGEPDVDAFREDLIAMFETLSHGRIAPTDGQVAMWFRLLAPHSLGAVRRAFEAFMREPDTGRTLPVPSDVIAKLSAAAKDDGRLGADEAWAIAVASADEAVTVVWTDEIAMAWGMARSIFSIGDEVGARLAFRDSYNRLVSEARRDGAPIRWATALGLDKRLQADAVNAAISIGRLTPPERPQLAGPAASIEQLSVGAPQQARETLARLQQVIAAKGDAPSADALARDETARLKAETAARVAAYHTEQST